MEVYIIIGFFYFIVGIYIANKTNEFDLEYRKKMSKAKEDFYYFIKSIFWPITLVIHYIHKLKNK